MNKNNLEKGMPAPDFSLPDAYGKDVSLSQFFGRPIILVFIRHMGSLHCRAHLSQIRQQYGRVQHARGEVIVISFAAPEALQNLIQAHKLPFAVLSDPQKEVYHQYGMICRQGGPLRTWKTIFTYLQLRLAGYPKPRERGDPLQMGGDVVIDPKGTVRYLFRSRFPEERPEASELVDIMTAREG